MDFDIKEICKHSVSSIKEKVSHLSDEDWDAFTLRQDTFDVHRQTKSILLRHENFEDYKKGLNERITKMFENDVILLEKVLNKKLGPGRIVDSTLINLVAGGKVLPHTDNFEGLDGWCRLHLPVSTNKDVIFTVGNTTLNMEEGTVYQIDNRNKMHGVVNNGATDRIHMLIEFFRG